MHSLGRRRIVLGLDVALYTGVRTRSRGIRVSQFQLKVLMMKVARQIWMISMTMEVRKKMKLEWSMLMLHSR
jgi:hypothetical protein